MIKINKIFKKRLTNKLNIKNRYILKNFRVIQPKKFRYFQYHKIMNQNIVLKGNPHYQYIMIKKCSEKYTIML
jgi:hypothetical protein